MNTLPDRTPIIVGVGQINDRPETPEAGLNPLQLMAAALQRAEADAGAALLGDADYVGVVQQISFRGLGDASGQVAQIVGATPKIAFETEGPNGDSPVMLLNDAANRIYPPAERGT